LNNKKLLGSHVNWIKSLIDNDCSISLRRICELFFETFGFSVGKSTIDRVIGSFHYSFKRVSLILERRNCTVVIEQQRIWAVKFMELLENFRETQFVFVDEFGVNISMRCRYGRSRVGTRAIHVVPNIRSRNISVCASMTVDGLLYFKAQDSAFNTASFCDYI
jgi:hypothetical protein